MKILLLIFLSVFSSFVYSAFDFIHADRFSLRAGIGFHTTSVFANNQSSQQLFGGSLSTSPNYRFDRFELGVNSNIIFGISPRKNTQYIQGSKVNGNYWVRAISFGPVGRYYFPYNSEWEVYCLGGPLWEITTLTPLNKRKVEVEGGHFNRNNGFRYLARGGILGVGFLKKTPQKSDRIYYELTYKMMRPYRVVVMEDASWKETIVETKEDITQKVTEHTLAFYVGLILF